LDLAEQWLARQRAGELTPSQRREYLPEE